MKSKAITREELEAEYRKCLERERIRRHKWRKTKQGGFESAFVSYDAMLGDSDGATDKLRCAGTLGSVISDPGPDVPSVCDPNKLKASCAKLRRHGKGHLVRTLQLIVKNGNNREESIWQIMVDTLKSIEQPKGNTTGKGKSSAGSSASKRTRGPCENND